MATQANEYMVISDGVTSVTFSDGSAGNTDYRVQDGWTPAVAHLSDSQLGGRGPYEDVTEKLDITVKGATWTAAKANVSALERLMQQAVRWARGENVAVVLVKWAPKGSTVATTAAPFQCVVLGGEFEFSQKWHQDQVTFQTNGKLTFQRRGAWIINTAVTGTSAAVANPGPYPITGMTSTNNISPADITFSTFTASSRLNFADSLPIILLAQSGSDLVLSEGEYSPLTDSAAVSDSSHNAHGGSVLRYTPTTTAEASAGLLNFTSITSSARRFSFFAALRNNSSSTTFNMRVAGLSLVDTAGSVTAGMALTPLVTIDASHTRPRFVPLGTLSMPTSLYFGYLMITASASTAASSGALDIDYVIALAVDNPYARVIQLTPPAAGASLQAYAAGIDVATISRVLSSISPAAYIGKHGAADVEYLGYYGDVYAVAASTTFQAAIMCKENANTAQWSYTGSAGSLINSLTLSVSRYNAYVAPE